MEKKTFTIAYETEEEYRLSDLKPREVELLRRVLEICREAKAKGNHPFGCLLADGEGNILMEQGNEEVTRNDDCTAHAESLLMRNASQKYGKETMAKLAMYSCGESCAMCTGAMYWANLGRCVYIARESAIKALTGNDIRNPTLDLPMRAVIAAGQKPMIIQGPYLELEPEFIAIHEGYWNPS